MKIDPKGPVDGRVALVALVLLTTALALAGCTGDGDGTNGGTRADVTGPTMPHIEVNCLGDSTFNVNVDCGPRGSFNPVVDHAE
jgi:hypothetical protein